MAFCYADFRSLLCNISSSDQRTVQLDKEQRPNGLQHVSWFVAMPAAPLMKMLVGPPLCYGFKYLPVMDRCKYYVQIFILNRGSIFMSLVTLWLFIQRQHMVDFSCRVFFKYTWNTGCLMYVMRMYRSFLFLFEKTGWCHQGYPSLGSVMVQVLTIA